MQVRLLMSWKDVIKYMLFRETKKTQDRQYKNKSTAMKKEK